MDSSPTAQLMRLMATRLKQAAEDLEAHAEDLETQGDWDAPGAALSTITNLYGNLPLDKLMTGTVREFQAERLRLATEGAAPDPSLLTGTDPE